MLWWDPLGLGSVSDAYSQKMFYSAIAPLYPNQLRSSDARRDDVLVVLFDNQDLEWLSSHKGFANTWPITYRNHASIIKRLNALKPRAVFWDIYFDAPRNTDHTLGKMMRAIKRNTSTFYLAAGGFQPFEMQAVLSPYAEYVSTVISSEDTGQYWLKDEQGRKSVAFALYRDACLRSPALHTCAADLLDESQLGNGSRMSVWWGINPPDKEVYGSYSRLLPSRWTEKTTEFPLQVINARELYYSDAATRQKVESLVHDSIVLFGADLNGENDLVSSPVHSLLPGVVLHAMAVDNLIRMGSEYKRVAQARFSLLGLPVDDGMIWNAALWLLCVLIVFFLFKWEAFEKKIVEENQWVWRYIIIFSIIALLVLSFSLWMFYVENYEPANAIQWLALGGLLAKFINPSEYDDYKLGWLNNICAFRFGK